MAEPQPNATDRRRVLERNHAEVVALLATGATQPEVAQRFGVARSTVLRFVERHQAELDAKKQRVALAVEDYAIAQKVERIAALNDRWMRIRRVIEERATSPVPTERAYEWDGDSLKHVEVMVPGWTTGLMVHTVKGVGKGADFRLIDLYEVDTGTLAEARNIEKAAADELGQIPRPDIHVGDKTTYVLQVIGTNGHVPLG